MLREVPLDLLLILHRRIERVPDRRIVQHDQYEADARVGTGELPLEPFPLFAGRPERRVRIQNQREERGSEAHRVPPVRPQGQSAERFPPVLEARGRVARGASRELVIAERGKHRDLLLRPLEGLALVGRVVVRIGALVNEVPADQDRGRVLARDPPDECAPRGRVHDLLAPAEARVAVDDEGEGSPGHRCRHLESGRLIARCGARATLRREQQHAQ